MSNYLFSGRGFALYNCRSDYRRLSMANGRRGQVALSLVFLIGSIAILIGVTLAFLVSGFLSNSFGYEASEKAKAVAAAGAEDAILQIIRDKSFSDTSGYTVQVGDYSAVVSVTQNSPEVGQATIISTAEVSKYKKKIKVVVSIDPITGETSVVYWKEVEI